MTDQVVAMTFPNSRVEDFKKSFQKNQGLRIGQAFYTYMKLDKCQQDDEFCERIWNVDDKDVWGLIGPRIDYNN